MTLPPYVASVRRTPSATGAPDTSAYTGGAISYDVEVVNPGRAPLSTTLTAQWVFPEQEHFAPAVSVPVDVPASSRAFVTVIDRSGLYHGCVPNRARLSLGTGATASLKQTMRCTFTGQRAVDSMATYTPDRRLALVAGKVWYHSAKSVTAGLACGSTLTAEAMIRNETSSAVRAYFKFDGHAPQERIDRETGGPLVPDVTVPARGERLARFSTPLGSGHAGAYKATLVTRNGAPTYQPGWYIDVSRSCTDLSFSIER